MALRRQSLSPTANLLRNSRLFALPTPLPKPNVAESYGAGITRASDSATLPYPTHQAIATTKSSLARGDWGLKRPLPARSRLVQTSNPVLRVTHLDTIEHITDFDSATDHVRTREKFEALGVPIMKGMSQMREVDLSGAPPKGAFEKRDDTTSYDTALGMDEAGMYLNALKKSSRRNSGSAKDFKPFSPPKVDAAAHNARRWKHEGPWLPGMNADDFATYLSKEISKRRTEFNTYMHEFVKNEIYTTRQLAASNDGQTPPEDINEAKKWAQERSRQWATITPQDIEAGIKQLRRETANDPLASKLVTKLILPFLRLPTIRFKNTAYAEHASNRDIEQYQFDQETAPLSTHPSAGLGYLRTRAYIANHPILGPQSQPAPIEARVVQPRMTSRGKETYAKLGVGGFVANDQFRSTDFSRRGADFNNARDVETIDIDTPGGKKVMVQPLFGSVSNDGRVHLKLKRSYGPEVAVAKGELDDKPPVREAAKEDQSDLLRNLAGGRSGVKELDEQSDKARQLSGFLEGMRPEPTGRGRPPRGFPGVGDALR